MKKYCKQRIPDNIKNKVWLRSCNYGGDIRLAQAHRCLDDSSSCLDGDQPDIMHFLIQEIETVCKIRPKDPMEMAVDLQCFHILPLARSTRHWFSSFYRTISLSTLPCACC